MAMLMSDINVHIWNWTWLDTGEVTYMTEEIHRWGVWQRRLAHIEDGGILRVSCRRMNFLWVNPQSAMDFVWTQRTILIHPHVWPVYIIMVATPCSSRQLESCTGCRWNVRCGGCLREVHVVVIVNVICRWERDSGGQRRCGRNGLHSESGFKDGKCVACVGFRTQRS